MIAPPYVGPQRLFWLPSGAPGAPAAAHAGHGGYGIRRRFAGGGGGRWRTGAWAAAEAGREGRAHTQLAGSVAPGAAARTDGMGIVGFVFLVLRRRALLGLWSSWSRAQLHARLVRHEVEGVPVGKTCYSTDVGARQVETCLSMTCVTGLVCNVDVLRAGLIRDCQGRFRKCIYAAGSHGLVQLDRSHAQAPASYLGGCMHGDLCVKGNAFHSAPIEANCRGQQHPCTLCQTSAVIPGHQQCCNSRFDPW